MPVLSRHLESKTIVGLIIILGVACTLACFGKLTSDMVEVLKWVGGSFMLVRGVANGVENLPGRTPPQ